MKMAGYLYQIGNMNSLGAQTVVQPFGLSDVKLLPSRFQQNMPFYDLHHHRYVVYWKKQKNN